MIKLRSNDYYKIVKLIKSQNELSVFSVIHGYMPGEIYVNDTRNPTVALIKTCECNFIAGSSKYDDFNSNISTELEYWDQLTPDSDEWIDIIPKIHTNPYVRRYTRRHYTLSMNDFREYNITLKDGYILEKVDLDILRKSPYKNSDKVIEWAENWGDDAAFKKYGVGYYIHNNETILSWSLSDCYCDKKIAIGIHTDEMYRMQGLAKIVVSATIKECFNRGYESIDWLCVDSNKGSIGLAESFGFKLYNRYYSFTSYPPIENIKDLSESEWFEWGEYLENASKTSTPLIWESLYSYIKANNMEKTISTMTTMEQRKITIDYSSINNYITYLQQYDLCTNFKSQPWSDFINKRYEIEQEKQRSYY